MCCSDVPLGGGCRSGRGSASFFCALTGLTYPFIINAKGVRSWEKCRARVAKGDTQYQCADQSCDFYGKLLCAACTVQVPIETEQQTSESELRPIGCLVVLLISIGVGVLVASFQSWGVIAIVTSISAVIGSALLFLYLGGIWFWSEWLLFKDVQVQVRSVAQHRCCVQCRHPVKKM